MICGVKGMVSKTQDNERSIDMKTKKTKKTDLKKELAKTKRELNSLVKAIRNYDSLRDDEWDFEDNHGNRDCWTEEVCEEHIELLNDIQAAREKVEKIIRRVTGDKNLNF